VVETRGDMGVRRGVAREGGCNMCATDIGMVVRVGG
jgi:hypothetical protein